MYAPDVDTVTSILSVLSELFACIAVHSPCSPLVYSTHAIHRLTHPYCMPCTSCGKPMHGNSALHLLRSDAAHCVPVCPAGCCDCGLCLCWPHGRWARLPACRGGSNVHIIQGQGSSGSTQEGRPAAASYQGCGCAAGQAATWLCGKGVCAGGAAGALEDSCATHLFNGRPASIAHMSASRAFLNAQLPTRHAFCDCTPSRE